MHRSQHQPVQPEEEVEEMVIIAAVDPMEVEVDEEVDAITTTTATTTIITTIHTVDEAADEVTEVGAIRILTTITCP
jgi:nucleoside-triphosphatase THEP1